MKRIASTFLLVFLATQCAHGPVASLEDECRGVESERFVVHSDPWINLHHFLYQWARNVPQRQPWDRMDAIEVKEAADLATLSEADRQAWQRAVDYYREQMIRRDLTFNRDIIAIREKLTGASCSGTTPAVDTPLAAVLSGAMPVYRRHWWPQHRAETSAWIAALIAALSEHERPIAQRLADAYGGSWPSEKVRVDTGPYANWAGAYTTNDPNRIVLATHYQGLEPLEMVFHEVSHATFFEQSLFTLVTPMFAGGKLPDRLVHTIQFATPSELFRSALGSDLPAGYRTVADRVYESGRFSQQYTIVLKHWRPYLAGTIPREEALRRIAAEAGQRH